MASSRLRLPPRLVVAVVVGVLGEACTGPSIWIEDAGDGCGRVHGSDDVVTTVVCSTEAGCTRDYDPDAGAFLAQFCPSTEAGCYVVTPPDGDARLECFQNPDQGGSPG
jgi:hypothetical protein